MTTHLSAATLSSLPGNIGVPKYRRDQLKAGILLSNFLNIYAN